MAIISLQIPVINMHPESLVISVKLERTCGALFELKIPSTLNIYQIKKCRRLHDFAVVRIR